MEKSNGAQRWQVIHGVCATHGGEGVTVYGVQVVCADGRVWRWADVSADREAVTRFAALMEQVQPEPCHWAELVEDCVAALSLD